MYEMNALVDEGDSCRDVIVIEEIERKENRSNQDSKNIRIINRMILCYLSRTRIEKLPGSITPRGCGLSAVGAGGGPNIAADK